MVFTIFVVFVPMRMPYVSCYNTLNFFDCRTESCFKYSLNNKSTPYALSKIIKPNDEKQMFLSIISLCYFDVALNASVTPLL